ncbi:hypothetical protein N7451_009916 [Penicillium sp. IBT 35674x]|nr:hypothetical protein N7451_009916 [Penicillium sp. IBT 35674x]
MWGTVTRELPQCGRAVWNQTQQLQSNSVAFYSGLYRYYVCFRGHFHSVTVNTALERPERLIGRVAELLSDRYTIVHIDKCIENNVLRINEIEANVKMHLPDVLANSTIGELFMQQEDWLTQMPI